MAAGLAALALGSNFLFRGAIADDSTQAWEWADAFLGVRPISLANVTEDLPPLYPALVHLSFQLLGHRLVALHLIPFLASVLDPAVAYLLFRDLFGSRRLGALGGLALLAWPTAVFSYNQAIAEPLTLLLVLGALLAFVHERTKTYALLALLSLFCAYDAVLIHAGVALESLLWYRRSTFHRRMVHLYALAGLGLAAAAALVHWAPGPGLLPVHRLDVEFFGMLRRGEIGFSAAKALGIAHLYFAWGLLPLVALGARRELADRRLWGIVPLGIYLGYETLLHRSSAPPMLGVTMRHLTLVVPSAVLLFLSGALAARELWRRGGPGSRMAWGGAAAATGLAALFVQAETWFYRTGVQATTDPLELVRRNPELPFHTMASGVPVVEVHPIAGAPAWRETVLPLPPGENSVEWLIWRGQVDLAGLWLEGGADAPARAVPLEGWSRISDAGGFVIVRRDGEDYLELTGGGGLLSGAAFSGGGRAERIRVRLRGEGPFVLTVVLRASGGRTFSIAMPSSRLPPGVDPSGLEHEIQGIAVDRIERAVLGFHGAAGLGRIGPLAGYDHVYVEEGGKVARNPQGWLRASRQGRAAEVGGYLAPAPGDRVELVYEAEFARPIVRLSLAGFFAHLVPGDRAGIRIESPDGSWRRLATIEGALGRSRWGAELDDPGLGNRLRLRITLETGDAVPELLRERLPAGLRDFAIGVRLAGAAPGRTLR